MIVLDAIDHKISFCFKPLQSPLRSRGFPTKCHLHAKDLYIIQPPLLSEIFLAEEKESAKGGGGRFCIFDYIMTYKCKAILCGQ